MPFSNGFVGFENYSTLLADQRFWSSLVDQLDLYRLDESCLQVALGLALALLVMDMKRGQGWFRVIAILPVVLSPAVVGMIWRTFMLAPEFGIITFLAINAGIGSKNWLRRSNASNSFGDCDPYLAVDAVRVHGAAGKPRIAA